MELSAKELAAFEPTPLPQAEPAPHLSRMNLENTHFQSALYFLKRGCRVARAGWYEGTFVVMMDALKLPPFNTQDTTRKVNDRTAKWIGEDTPLDCQPYLAIYHGHDNGWQPGWTPGQDDLFAEDWKIFE